MRVAPKEVLLFVVERLLHDDLATEEEGEEAELRSGCCCWGDIMLGMRRPDVSPSFSLWCRARPSIHPSAMFAKRTANRAAAGTRAMRGSRPYGTCGPGRCRGRLLL